MYLFGLSVLYKVHLFANTCLCIRMIPYIWFIFPFNVAVSSSSCLNFPSDTYFLHFALFCAFLLNKFLNKRWIFTDIYIWSEFTFHKNQTQKMKFSIKGFLRKYATSSPAHLFAIRGRWKRGPRTLQTRDQNLPK